MNLIMLRELERANKKVAEDFEKDNGRNLLLRIMQVGGNERLIADTENRDKDLLSPLS